MQNFGNTIKALCLSLSLCCLSSTALAQAVIDVGSLGGGSTFGTMTPSGSTVTGGTSDVGDAFVHVYRWTLLGGFQDLGTLGGTFANPTAISSDGNTIVGTSETAGGLSHAFRWTSGGGMQDLGSLLVGGDSAAMDASSDGAVVAGFTQTAGPQRAFRWTSGGGMQLLGALIVGSLADFGRKISSDGSVISGDVLFPGGLNRIFRWTSGGGLVNIGSLPLPGYSGNVVDMSDDGNVILSTNNDVLGGGGTRAAVWTSAGGVWTDIGDLGSPSAGAADLSADGSTVVGVSNGQAFRWTSGGGIQSLGAGAARATNIDGSFVVGSSIGGAFIWDAVNGLRDISTLMTSLGVNMTGINLLSGEAVSDDGSIVAATGGNSVYMVFLTGGVITPSELSNSLASMGGLAEGMLGFVGSDLMQQAKFNVMPTGKNMKLAAAGDDWSKYAHDAYNAQYPIWAYVSGTGVFSSDKTEGEGSVGVVWQATDNLRVGGGPLIGARNVDLTRGGEADFTSFGAGVFMAYEEKACGGPRFYASTYWRSLDAEIDRGYLNGASNATSHGETDGREFGITAETGWCFKASDVGLASWGNTTTVTPFVGFEYQNANLDGYSETSGGILATFEDFEYDRALISAGARAEHKYSDDLSIWGSGALVFNASKDDFRIRGSIGGLGAFDTEVDIESHSRVWLEPAIGANWMLSDNALLSAYALGRIRDESEAQIGLTLSFRM